MVVGVVNVVGKQKRCRVEQLYLERAPTYTLDFSIVLGLSETFGELAERLAALSLERSGHYSLMLEASHCSLQHEALD